MYYATIKRDRVLTVNKWQRHCPFAVELHWLHWLRLQDNDTVADKAVVVAVAVAVYEPNVKAHKQKDQQRWSEIDLVYWTINSPSSRHVVPPKDDDLMEIN